MGKYDRCMKAYLQDKRRFADLFNGSCFQGRQVIRAEDLEEASENYVVTEEKQSGKPLQKGTEIIRDVKMRYRSGMILQVLAVENQSYTDYGMPVRCMGYDAAEYSRQLKERKQERRLLLSQKEKASENAEKSANDQKNSEGKAGIKVTADEQLSGILKTDRLHPVYTICLYSGVEPWDGPRKLSDMMEFDPEEESVQSLFKDYPLTLFCVNEQDGFGEFHSDLKQLFRAMNYRKNKEKMAELIRDEAYSHLSEETWEAIAVMTDNAAMLQKKELYKTENQEKEEYNMCQALEELMEDKRNEGEKIGEKKGEIKGNLERTKIVVRNMLCRGYEIEDVCAIAECDSSLVEEVRKNMA